MSSNIPEIKIRYTFKRKSDGHLYQVVYPLGCMEDACRDINGFRKMMNNELWDIAGRDLFTGLLDKNKAEVYENDIVKYFHWCHCCVEIYNDEPAEIIQHFEDAYGNKSINRYNTLKGLVKWNNEAATYEPLVSSEYDFFHNCFADICHGSDGNKNYPESFFEVIGDIYSNSELIKNV